MLWQDIIGFITQVLSRQRFRTIVLAVSVAIGVVSVNLLVALGEGAKSYVLKEFSLLGRNTLIILPGKKETKGGMPPITGESPRPITLRDAQAVSRLTGVSAVAPLVLGNVEVSYAGKLREVLTLGSNRAFFAIRHLQVEQGLILPALPFNKGELVCVIGNKLRKELFSGKQTLGEWLRIGDRRFRVIGVLKDSGTSFGFDMSDAIIIPVVNAQSLFNVEGLFRLFVDVRAYPELTKVKAKILSLMKKRHEGIEDITIISQDAMLASVQGILDTLTYAIAGIASISMLVAGVLIMNMMIITVSQRTREIGLLKALGATASTVRVLFLFEAGLIAVVAGAVGLALAHVVMLMANSYFDDIQFHSPWWSQLGSVMLAIVFALLFAWLPAQRAAFLAPVEALQGKQQRGKNESA